MRKSRKILVAVIVLIVVLAAAGRVVLKRRRGEKPVTVQIAKAELGELVEFVSAPGEIEPRKKVEISAKFSARIIELPVDEGDVVTCGDPEAEPPVPASLLLQLDAKDLESQLVSAEAGRSALTAQVEVDRAVIASQNAALEGLGATLEEAERDSARKKGLLESQDISQSMYDQVKYRADELRARFTAAEHTLKAAELNIIVLQHNLEGADARIAQAKELLSHTTISSPIDGVVTRVNAEMGEMVMTGTMNNPGTVIMEVADLSQMLVVAQVDEADIGGLEVGQRAKVEIQAFSDIEFEGTVDTIALMHNWSENRTKYFRTEILLDNDPNVRKLYSGLTADVDIQTRRHPDVMKVPSQAVLAREVDGLPLEIRENSAELNKNKTHATVVYRYNDGKAVVTPVKIGPSDLTHIIITAGVTEEDRIVIGPYKVLDGLKHDQDLKDEREVKSEADEASEKTDANKPKK